MTIDEALQELESLLPGVNYVVNFAHHRVPVMPDSNPEQYIVDALGTKTVVGGITGVTAAEMLADVEQCLRWPGTAVLALMRRHSPHRKCLNLLPVYSTI